MVSRVLARARCEFCSASHSGNERYIQTPRLPSPRTLTNHTSVYLIWGVAKSVAVLPTGYGESLIYWFSSAGLDQPAPLVFS